MPLEIRELVIKATVGNEENSGGNAGSSSQNSTGHENEMIQQCVNAVLAILKQEKER